MTDKAILIGGENIHAQQIGSSQSYQLLGGAIMYDTVASGQVGGGTTAAQLPDVACKRVLLRAGWDNAGTIYVGASSSATTPAAGTATNATTGLQLKAGDATPWLDIPNLNKLYRICSGTADYLTYLVQR